MVLLSTHAQCVAVYTVSGPQAHSKWKIIHQLIRHYGSPYLSSTVTAGQSIATDESNRSEKFQSETSLYSDSHTINMWLMKATKLWHERLIITISALSSAIVTVELDANS
jgi:hypothetical protein